MRSDQSLSCVRLFATPWIAARQASLSITNSWSGDLRLTQTEVENTQVCWVLQNCCTFVLERVPPPWAFQRLPLCVKASPHGDTSHYMANYRCVWFPLFFLIIIDYIIIKKKKRAGKNVPDRKLACVSVTKPIWSITNFSNKVSLRYVKVSAHVFGLFRWNLNVITFFSFRISTAAISILIRILFVIHLNLLVPYFVKWCATSL